MKRFIIKALAAVLRFFARFAAKKCSCGLGWLNKGVGYLGGRGKVRLLVRVVEKETGLLVRVVERETGLLVSVV